MSSKNPTIQRAKEINKKIQQIFDEEGVRPIMSDDTVNGIVIIRFSKRDTIAITALGKVDFILAAAAMVETSNQQYTITEQETSYVA